MPHYSLPKLPYDYNALSPAISGEQLRLHHEKHHQAYVDGANALLGKMENARASSEDVDMKSILKSLSFNAAGHVLHSLFWKCMKPNGGGEPSGNLAAAIKNDFGSFARFRQEFTQAALTVEGSGWAALSFDKDSGKLLIMQVEKHNVNAVPSLPLLLVLDVWEHAYYLDYRNARAKFIEAFWGIVDWGYVCSRFDEAQRGA